MSAAVANLSPVAEGGRLAADAMTVRLGAGLGLPDLAVGASDCGQYLMLTCGGELIALIGSTGSDVETVEFADGSHYRVEELMDRVSGGSRSGFEEREMKHECRNLKSRRWRHGNRRRFAITGDTATRRAA